MSERLSLAETCVNTDERGKKFIVTATVAEHLEREYHFINSIETDTLYIYDEDTGAYDSHGEQTLKRRLEEDLRDYLTKQKTTEIITKIKHKAMMSHDIFCSVVSPKREDGLGGPFINLKNGVYDLEDGSLGPHSDGYYFLGYLPVDYDENAKPDKIIKFLTDCLAPDYESIMNTLESGAYALLPDNHLGKAMMLVGSGGNGKGTWLSINRALYGEQNCTAITIQQLSSDRFAAAQLYGKIANFGIEIPPKELWDTTIFKNITTDDSWVTAQFKNRSHFTFKSTAKNYYSANQIPKTSDLSDAFFDRWLITEWKRRFRGTADEKTLLIEELTAPQQLSGLLNLYLEIIKWLAKAPTFTFAPKLEEITQIYTNRSSSAQAFVDECVISAPFGTDVSTIDGVIDNAVMMNEQTVMLNDDVREHYYKYCKARGLNPESEKDLFNTIRLSRPGYDSMRKTQKGVTKWYCTGIRLKKIPEQAQIGSRFHDFESCLAEYERLTGLHRLHPFWYPLLKYSDSNNIREEIGKQGAMGAIPATDTQTVLESEPKQPDQAQITTPNAAAPAPGSESGPKKQQTIYTLIHQLIKDEKPHTLDAIAAHCMEFDRDAVKDAIANLEHWGDIFMLPSSEYKQLRPFYTDDEIGD